MSNKNNIEVMNFSQIKLPTFTEKSYSSKPYISYGSDNKFPYFLQELAKRSSLHNAILQSKLDYAYDKGLEVTDSNLASDLFINHPNPQESLNDIYRKCLSDFIMFGGYCLNIIWSQDKQNISEIYHIPFETIRCGKKNERGQVETYYYSADWSKYNAEYKTIPAFSYNNRVGSQLLYEKRYQSGCYTYPLPSYQGAITDIATSTEISNFHLANITNNMMPSVMITFTNGIPSEEERRTIKAQFEEQYTSTDNAGKFILSFVEDETKAPKVDTLNSSDNGEQYLNLYNTIQTSILAGHQIVSPYLVGIRSDGVSFGSGTELANSFKLFYNTVITNIQSKVVTTLNNVLKLTAGWEHAELEATEPIINFQ